MQISQYGRGIGAERSLKRHAGRFGRTAKHSGKRKKGAAGGCKCPKCGRKEPRIPGIRCEQIFCTECGAKLREA